MADRGGHGGRGGRGGRSPAAPHNQHHNPQMQQRPPSYAQSHQIYDPSQQVYAHAQHQPAYQQHPAQFAQQMYPNPAFNGYAYNQNGYLNPAPLLQNPYQQHVYPQTVYSQNQYSADPPIWYGPNYGSQQHLPYGGAVPQSIPQSRVPYQASTPDNRRHISDPTSESPFDGPVIVSSGPSYTPRSTKKYDVPAVQPPQEIRPASRVQTPQSASPISPVAQTQSVLHHPQPSTPAKIQALASGSPLEHNSNITWGQFPHDTPPPSEIATPNHKGPSSAKSETEFVLHIPSSEDRIRAQSHYQGKTAWVSHTSFPARRQPRKKKTSSQVDKFVSGSLPPAVDASTTSQDSPIPTAVSTVTNSSLPIGGDKPDEKVLDVSDSLTATSAVPQASPIAGSTAAFSGQKQEVEETSNPDTTHNENSTGPSTPQESVPKGPPVNPWLKTKVWSQEFSGGKSSNSTVGHHTTGVTGSQPTSAPLADILESFTATSSEYKVQFLEPRGLVNAQNMCYMNSVLQALVFCPPVFNLLDRVDKLHKADIGGNSATPLLDAMVNLKKEYKVLATVRSAKDLGTRLEPNDYETSGQAFTPHEIYNAMKRNPRFSEFEFGKQHDAQEFLVVLLDVLHEECVEIIKASGGAGKSARAREPAENSWQPVKTKQKASVTRSNGAVDIESPTYKIFGGKWRSELRVPGLPDSVTIQPFTALHLEIHRPEVHNIVDALKYHSRPEPVTDGNFKSPRGPDAPVVKQAFLESPLPSVFIFHLIRFGSTGTGMQKIRKKISYPVDLEIPKEVFTRSQRSLNAHNLPIKYRLMAVIYHIGESLERGHYKVDVRRQDDRTWLRLNDQDISRVGSENVADGGSDADAKALSLEHPVGLNGTAASGNSFSAIENADEAKKGEWKQATGQGKKTSSATNGSSTPKKVESSASMKDATAYLLFYQRI